MSCMLNLHARMNQIKYYPFDTDDARDIYSCCDIALGFIR